MRSLQLRLTLVIVVSSLLAVALVGVAARWITSSQFDRLRVAQARASFVDTVTGYYRDHGSFDGVEGLLVADVQRYLTRSDAGDAAGAGAPEARADAPAPADAGRWPADRYMRRSPFALVDASGATVIGAGPLRPGERPDAATLRGGTPVVLDGTRIGTVLYFAPPELRSLERVFLQHTGAAVLLATVGAMALALILGVVSARMLTRPVHDLTQAIRGMRGGQLQQSVPVRSRDELGELARAFNDMSAQVSHVHFLREQMTADIAHELRTPLSVVTGYLEAIRDGVLEATPETVATLHDEARHLQVLVEDLRTLSLADAGRLALQREPLQPLDLLRSVRQAFAPLAETAGVALELGAPAPTPPIEADGQRIRQVLDNLVANALRYTPRGGRVVLSAREGEGGVELSVADTGSGMAPETLQHVFERFYRADASRQAEGGASGLGLAIARSLVEAHGGTIQADSRLGAGTVMRIVLPAAPA